MGAENKLTDARVRTAKAEGRELFLSDGGGLRIRILPPSTRNPKGARIAQYAYKLRSNTSAGAAWRNATIILGTLGEPFTDAAGNVRPFTLADARAARDAARALVAKEIDPREARKLSALEAQAEQRRKLAEHEALANRRTVRSAFESWRSLRLARPEATGGTARKDGGEAVAAHFGRHVLPHIGDVALEEIRRRDHVVPILHRLVAAGKMRSANVTLALLRQFFRWCAAQDWIEGDPTFGLSRADVGGAEASRERNLSFEEIAALPAAMEAAKLAQRMRAVVLLLLATGARVGELARAGRGDFDLALGEWRIPADNSKNGLAHVVHLSDFAAEQVRALDAAAKKAGSPWLLPGRDPKKHISEKTATKAIRDRQRPKAIKGRSKQAGALVLAGGEWTPHDLRRTMASRMQELGIAPHVIEKCLNHTLEGVAGVYQRAELLPERRDAFERWGAKLAATLRGERPAPVADLEAERQRRRRAPGAGAA